MSVCGYCACRLLSWGDGNTIYDAPVGRALPSADAAGPADEAPAPASEPAVPKAAPAVLCRGDTEVKITYGAAPVTYRPGTTREWAIDMERDSQSAFPFFPPPRLHVAAGMGDIDAAAFPSVPAEDYLDEDYEAAQAQLLAEYGEDDEYAEGEEYYYYDDDYANADEGAEPTHLPLPDEPFYEPP